MRTDRDHRQPAVVQLLGLHLRQLSGGGRLEAEGIKAQITRLVISADAPRLAAKGRLEAEDGEDLEDGDEHDHRRPESLEGRLPTQREQQWVEREERTAGVSRSEGL